MKVKTQIEKTVLVARGLTKSWMTELACEDSIRLPGRVGLTDHRVEPSSDLMDMSNGQSVWFTKILVSPQRPIGLIPKTSDQMA